MREISPHDEYDKWSDGMDDLFPDRIEDEAQAFLAGFAAGYNAVQIAPHARKEKCRNGHPQTLENTYYLRTCRQCQLNRSEKWRKEQR